MERRVALAAAAAAAVTLGLGTVAFASIGGGDLLGLSDDGQATQIVPGSNVEQITRVVVVSGTETTIVAIVPVGDQTVAPPADGNATPPPVVVPVNTAAPSAGASTTPTTTKATTTSAVTQTTTKSTVTATTQKPTTTTTAAPNTTNPTTTPAPTTTVKVTSTTVRPPGVPADWPAGKPIPPMPAGCKKPQLELNGVWNCDD